MTRNKEILNSLITLTVREVRRFLRIWVQTLVPPAVTMSLYFVIFGSLIGPRIGEMNGLDYIQFMIPGFVMLSARGVMVGIIVFLVSLFFYPDFTIVDPLLTISVLILTAILFSLMGFLNAIYADTFDDISVVPTFVLTPLIYLGGVFYSITILPEFWQKVSLANPMLYVVNTFRQGMLGVSDISVSFSLIMQVFFIILFGAFALHLLKKGTGIRQ